MIICLSNAAASIRRTKQTRDVIGADPIRPHVEDGDTAAAMFVSLECLLSARKHSASRKRCHSIISR